MRKKEERWVKIVQIDESKFGKRKYNRGRRIEDHWILGIIDNHKIICVIENDSGF